MQWITLFDHPDDDVYDGLLGEDDEEVPRIQVEFFLEEVVDRPKGGPKKADSAKDKPSAGTTSKAALRATSGQARTGSGRGIVPASSGFGVQKPGFSGGLAKAGSTS